MVTFVMSLNQFEYFVAVFLEYRILGKKGEGTFSEVLKCQNIKEGTYFACKKMKQQYER